MRKLRHEVKVGDVFNRLTVLEDVSVDGKKRNAKFNCICLCGNTKTVTRYGILWGGTSSCGCLQREKATKHGHCKSRTYITWSSMLSRCFNKKNHSYERYGGVGITVCERWKKSFPNFLKDMGERPLKMTLDRIDNYKGYNKKNCRWATTKQQAINKRNVVKITFNGATHTIDEWAKITGIKRGTLDSRKRRNFPTKKILSKGRAGALFLYDKNGTAMTVSQINKLTGINKTTFLSRIRSGWCVEKAMSEKIQIHAKGTCK